MHPSDPLGRATRATRPDGTELWRLPAEDQATAQWLVWMGERGIGGFTQSGQDAEGWWLVRSFRGQPLATWLQSQTGAIPWRDAVTTVQRVASLLALCEEQGQFPGPIQPHNVLYAAADGGVELRADPWVTRSVGGPADSGERSQSLSSRWMAPEQAAGAAADYAGNRYVLGLLLYRLLAGEHPFGGMGLRLALEQARRGAPPMREDVATVLPPGLQTYTLQMLDPNPAARPSSAQAIATELGRFLEDKRATDAGLRTMFVAASTSPITAATPGAAVPAPVPGTPPSRPASAWPRRLGSIAAVVVPVALGIAAATVTLARVGSTPDRPDDAPKLASVQPRAPLQAGETTAEDCAYCHPRQTAQWHRSVMGHSAKSPLFLALEILIQEQVARSDDCPHGAGILRIADPRTACRNKATDLPITGAGGEHWCVNCHVPTENLDAAMPAWDGISDDAKSRHPINDLVDTSKMEGIGCAFCHQVHGPVAPGNERKDLYEGNPYWTSFQTGKRFFMRPEDLEGVAGIANSGYFLDPAELLVDAADGKRPTVPGGVHLRPSDDGRAYLRSSEFCGACHDVRLFGSDAFGAKIGENFKRLRNAYTEWAVWADAERKTGRKPASCQDCHMSLYPGVCVRGEGDVPEDATALRRACPEGTHFESRPPGTYPKAPVAAGSAARDDVTIHYFSGVDIPLTPAFDEQFIDQPTLDAAGIPLGGTQRRDILLGKTFRFDVDGPNLDGDTLEIPVVLENTGGGHRVPAGFSQEREFWVHLRIVDADGELVYEVGRVDRGDEDLHDKEFVEVNVEDDRRDAQGRPLGLFGANVKDGPDHPQWSPDPLLGGTEFRGKGLVNLQNGFLRCVRCIGRIAADGSCQPGLFQGRHRADRFEDGQFDIDTGTCISNLDDEHKFFEVFFPVGSLDAERGVVSGPDAIIDTRSAPPGVPLRYTYVLDTDGAKAPYTIEARLMFRAFPPFLVRAFADYEALQAKKGLRPSGPLVTHDMLQRLEAVELHRKTSVVK